MPPRGRKRQGKKRAARSTAKPRRNRTVDFIEDDIPKARAIISTFSVPPRLQNFGNTCFMNSALQALISLRSLRQSIIEGLKPTEDSHPAPHDELELYPSLRGDLSKSFTQFLVDAAAGVGASVGPLFGRICDRLPFFADRDQHDSSEFLRLFLDGLDAETRAFAAAHADDAAPSPFTQPFRGVIANVATCTRCGRALVSFERFLDISLALADSADGPVRGGRPRKKDRRRQKAEAKWGRSRADGGIMSGVSGSARAFSLEQLLRAHLDTTIVKADGREGFECMFCSLEHDTSAEARELLRACEAREFEDTDTLAALYARLGLRARNYSDAARAHWERADKRRVDIELRHILMAEFLPPVLCVHLKRFAMRVGHDRGGMFIEATKDATAVTYPRELDLAHGFVPDLPAGEAVYRLRAVVVHHGTLDGGHYTAVVRADVGGDARWFHCDDDHISECAQKQALAKARGAYILFYERAAPAEARAGSDDSDAEGE
eukprot:gnl/Chilomastix_cuspidata/3368.p1 GENE.gnl/Chilomastix_cuspidata/3368~~gnl/Chilomastix_cuspidata/3368.p1  ORF type:complete len:492 (+),score=201.84 gnl/Chilomastix_cuspidata/3368:615-2090(+)